MDFGEGFQQTTPLGFVNTGTLCEITRKGEFIKMNEINEDNKTTKKIEDKELVIYCFDVGSYESIGWYRWLNPSLNSGGSDIDILINHIQEDLKTDKIVALGFECPIFIPTVTNKKNLLKARKGDSVEGQSRPWSAGAGAIVSVAGLQESLYIFNKLMSYSVEFNIPILPTFNKDDLYKCQNNLLIWEALISGTSKQLLTGASSHEADAFYACKLFYDRFTQLDSNITTNNNEEYFTIIGASLLRSGLSNDINIMKEKCIAIKP